MSTLDHVFQRLWEDYLSRTPQALRIRDLLESRGETVINDHIALRTFDHPRFDVNVMSRPFIRFGYRRAGEYRFEQKRLSAIHLEHENPANPKIFISELKIQEFPRDIQEIIQALLAQADGVDIPGEDVAYLGRPWELHYSTYERLGEVSEYAAWVAAHGFCANHFTVLVNSLKTFAGLSELNRFLIDHGFKLNVAGGEIKGSQNALLEQSSTIADEVEVEFADGMHLISGCYYEFAKRYPLPDGRLFQGFIAPSANRIFESTDRRWSQLKHAGAAER